MTSPSARTRKTVLLAVIAVLAAWYGLSRWQIGAPASAAAAQSASAGDEAPVSDRNATAEPPPKHAPAAPPVQDMQRPWPPNPFAHASGSEQSTTIEGGSAAPPSSSTHPIEADKGRFMLSAVIAGDPPFAIVNVKS